jgi:hypothetical protein
MSFSAVYPLEYKKGLRKTRGVLPTLRRASFNMETNEANVGEEQDVPATGIVWPW